MQVLPGRSYDPDQKRFANHSILSLFNSTGVRCENVSLPTPIWKSSCARREIMRTMTRQEVLDLYFMDARSKLIDLAAFLDRVDRAAGETDFRWDALQHALARLVQPGPGKAEKVLLEFSDPTTQPISAATIKAACGAWPGKKR